MSKQSQKQESFTYQELRIKPESTKWGWLDGPDQNSDQIEKRVLIKNGFQALEGCQVVLEELAYQFQGEWTEPANGYQQKALRWAEEHDPQAGRIAIPRRGSVKLSLLTLYRYPNPYFGVAYGDGGHGKTHHFIGQYRMRLRLEGKLSDQNPGQALAPIIYEIYLRYVGTLELEIEKIERIG